MPKVSPPQDQARRISHSTVGESGDLENEIDSRMPLKYRKGNLGVSATYTSIASSTWSKDWISGFQLERHCIQGYSSSRMACECFACSRLEQSWRRPLRIIVQVLVISDVSINIDLRLVSKLYTNSIDS